MTSLVDQRAAELVDVETGEALAPTADNAARVILAARRMKERVQGVIEDATAVLRAQSTRDGTKTLETEHGKVTLSGGETIEYDPHDLMEALRVAGCPEERIERAVVAEITYKVNRSVLKQLAAANVDYKTAIAVAERHVEKPYRASVKP